MKHPDGKQVHIHDTNWTVDRPEVAEDEPIPNIELNAYGHYALGGGLGDDGMQAHLHFCPRNRGPHYHFDRLGIILWGADEELLADIGYQHVGEPARYFANRQTAHNMVHVLFDEEPQAPETPEPEDLPTDPVQRFKAVAEAERPRIDARSRVLAYDPGTVSDGRVELVSAASPGPDWLGIDRRERGLLMIRVDDRRSYLVDVFRVRGGDRHRFILRGSADEDMTVDQPLALEPVPGTLAGSEVPYGEHDPDAEPYTWFVHDLKRAMVSEPWEMTWTGVDSGSSLRIFLSSPEASEVTLAKSPSLRQANHDDRLADEFMAPHLLVERDESGAGNLFAAVYDVWPDDSAPAVESVSFERLGDGAEAPIALRVQLSDGREDIVYTSLDREQRAVGPVTFSGSWAVASSADGAAAWGWTHDGSVAVADTILQAADPLTLPITEVRRVAEGADANALVVEGTIPDADALAGQWIRARLGTYPRPHTAYEATDPAAANAGDARPEDSDGNVTHTAAQVFAYRVDGVRPEGDRTIIEIAGEPGFALTEDGWELLFNPFHEGPGPTVIEITRSAFAAR
jgi:hypothetical protein